MPSPLVFFFAILSIQNAAPIGEQTVANPEAAEFANAEVANAQAVPYLSEWGFLPDSSNGPASSADVFAAIKDYQSTYDLPVTGVMNSETKGLMSSPRCGIKDKGNREKRALDLWWRKKNIRYHIASFPPGLSRDFVKSEMERAFNGWKRFMSGRTFQQVGNSNDADIVLNFYTSGQHNKVCKSKWDSSSILAHAFFPQVGQIHFNLDHSWTEPDKIGSVFFHEIGHALGLDHVNQNKLNLMYPYYVSGPKHFAGSSINALKSTYSK